ncbi:hypothetical protein BDY19DRAFT_939486 [Irpex rosettiformis]|uniref:Uncharacterized protein n=1 Tax=Irpex rosettiformis TaxID=378272 RepID=A0ACB8U7V4_9APHY|nr:hypothetical protein BDY19DRAFT_939486 [Irpex rosettiformis]
MTTGSTVNPSEVGWQFVPQYYTFVNKQPNRLHCFYTKASTFIHGTEGEDGKTCYGQQEIHAKITSIGFQDCKVFIHSVDAQSSAQGGIIIQVIGEMSNKGDPWRKFVQTFFLAEQPNGYFVLNDIFRFLKEDAVDDEPTQDESLVQDVSSQELVPSSLGPVTSFQPEPETALTPTTPAPVAAALEPQPEPTPTPIAEEQVNGVHEPEAEPEAAPVPAESEPAALEPAAPSPAPSTPAPAPAAQPSPAPTAAPVAQPPAAQPPVASAPAPAPAAPTPSAPPVRKTWANLAAAGSQKWGANVAEAKGVSEAPASSSSPAPAGTSQSPAPRQPQNQHPALTAALNVTTAHCFVKGVVETVSDAALRATLTQRFGPIKDIEILRNKACAFLEFNQLDAAKRAIIASLPVNAGGEGGIRIGEGSADGPPPRISIETRKERSERGPPRGAVNGDRGRGGFRGGRGAPRGRGIPSQK